MKKLISAALCGLFVSAAAAEPPAAGQHRGTSLPTPDPRVTCALSQLTEDEVEELFFNQETWRFQQRHNVLIDATLASLAGANNGRHYGLAQYSIANETAQQMSMKDLASVYQPIKVVIRNNSDQAITIQRTAYILAYAQALTTADRVADLYPNFNAKRISMIGSGVATALFSGLLGVVGIGCVGSAVAISQRTGRMGLFLSGLGCSAVAALLGWLASVNFKTARWAGRLRDKVERLRAVAPKLAQGGQKARRLPIAAQYTIPAGAEFRDILILNMPSLNSSTSLFGQARPEPKLSYSVGESSDAADACSVKLW